MKYFRFRSWREHQHYHDRNPPWIKLYVDILDPDGSWAGLDDRRRGQLANILAYASRMDNVMPMDNDMISQEIGATSPLDLLDFNELIEIHDNRASCYASESASKVASKFASENARPRVRVRVRDQNVEKEEKEFRDLPEAERLCRQLADAIRDNRPTARLPEPGTAAWDRWTADMDLMLRRDHRTEQEAAGVIAWCQRDDFWKANILSPSKLRKQYDTLALQMRRPVGASGKRQDVAAANKASLAAVYRVLDGEAEQP